MPLHIDGQQDGVARGAMLPQGGMLPNADRREYLHEKSDLLFVVEHLPEDESPDLIFGTLTRKVFQTMQAAGLIRIEEPDPYATELDVFLRGDQPGFKHASIVQLARPAPRASYSSFVIHDWERICERLLSELNVQKLVLVGTRVVKSYASRTLRHNNPSQGFIGYCKDEVHGRTVPTYAVSLKGTRVEDWRLLGSR